MMPKVVLTARAGLRYEGVRYRQGDVLTVSDKFLAAHPTRFELVSEPPKRRKPKKKIDPAPIPEAQETEVVISGDNAGDNS